MARKLTSVAKKGTRLEQLKKLSIMLADMIDKSMDSRVGTRDLPNLSKQYRETIKEIEEIEGGVEEDDEIGEILSSRKADGKSNSIRKNFS